MKMDHLDDVIYSQVMLAMELEELVRLNYQPDANPIHQQIYENNAFWQRKVDRRFNVPTTDDTLNWRYVYWMLHKSGGDLHRALIDASLACDMVGADLAVTLGAKISNQDLLELIDSPDMFEEYQQWQCIIKHAEVNEQHLRQALYECSNRPFVYAVVVYTNFIIDADLILDIYRRCSAREWWLAGNGHGARLVARSSRVDRQLLVDWIERDLAEVILEHLIKADAVPPDVHNIIRQGTDVTIGDCIWMLVKHDRFTVDTLLLSLILEHDSKRFHIMFDRLKHELTQDQLLQILTMARDQEVIVSILSQTSVDLSCVNIDEIMNYMWCWLPIAQLLLKHSSFDPSQYDNKPLKGLVTNYIDAEEDYGCGPNPYEECLDLWLKDPRVKVTNEVLILAQDDKELLNKLLGHASARKSVV